MEKSLEIEYQGIYGKFRITPEDEREVRNYRIALLICGLSFTAGLIQWMIFGGDFTWIWLLAMCVSLGFALQWIHIYVQFLHKSLQLLWAIGFLGIIFLMMKDSPQMLLPKIASKPILTLLIGPYFAAMTGLGFKEFFCFQRPEAIGLTLLLPISLGGHMLKLLNPEAVMILLFFSAILLVILGLRKFNMDPASDIGDKSVFEHLEKVKSL